MRDKITNRVDGREYTPEEIEYSSRIQKSVTPKGTLDWHLKWIASIWLIVAISFRSTGIPTLQFYDMLFSFGGTALWAVVGFMWRDRALIVINTIAAVMLFGGLLSQIFSGV
jgi:hypothetical protein